MDQPAGLGAFIDESSANRGNSTQEYLIGAAILDSSDHEAIGEELQPLRLQRKTERFRRKCLETLYYELASADVFSATLESRSPSQDSRDRAHVVALQGQGLHRGIRIQHLRGGDEPLLWIPDAVLGSIDSARMGDPSYLDALRGTIFLEQRTPDSLDPCEWADERP